MGYLPGGSHGTQLPSADTQMLWAAAPIVLTCFEICCTPPQVSGQPEIPAE